MRSWIALALGCAVVLVLAYVYLLNATVGQGASSIGLANTAGIILVLIGILAAGLVLKRARPPGESAA